MLLKVDDLHKSFEDNKAKRRWLKRKPHAHVNVLKGIGFDVNTSETIGVLGANGAGKTTLLRTLSGALQADQGTIQLGELSPTDALRAYQKQIGFLSGARGLYERLTVQENLTFFARLYEVPDAELPDALARVSDAMKLDAFFDKRVMDLSTGMRQRAAIARAVIHQPQLVVLDEPTTGLDIVAKELVLEFIGQLKVDGASVLFSTHQLDEVELLCDRILVIRQGEVAFFGSIEHFCEQQQQTSLHNALKQSLHLGGYQ